MSPHASLAADARRRVTDWGAIAPMVLSGIES
jgi:hypothetical protein